MTSLPTSTSCSLYADNLAIYSSSPSVPTATQRALIRLERWSKDWRFSLNSRKCESSFLLVDPHQANLQPHLLFNFLLGLNSTSIIDCLRSSPIFLLTQGSLLPLQVTLTHFALQSYKRDLRHPASFPILNLAKLRKNLDFLSPCGESLRHSHVYAFSFFPQGDSFCLPFHSSLEYTFVQSRVYFFYCMLSL